jgi:hypothetical protein
MRRALLLFAIVLGLAALAASVSQPREERADTSGDADSPAAPSSPSATSSTAQLRFTTSGKRERRRLDPGRPAVVVVEADQPGLAELDGLGLSAPAEELTPARFNVLSNKPVSATVRFTPAATGQPETVGTLSVSEREPARSDAPRARKTERDR